MVGCLLETGELQNPVQKARRIAETRIARVLGGSKRDWETLFALELEKGERVMTAGKKVRKCHLRDVSSTK
jgi:hypothetical protein